MERAVFSRAEKEKRESGLQLIAEGTLYLNTPPHFV